MNALPIAAPEAEELLAPLASFPRVALAVSGGPDSIALMFLARRRRGARAEGPSLIALTVDHGLRPESRAEAEQVGRLASRLGLPHVILTWERQGPHAAGLQERAREARYALMAGYCHAHDIPAIVTAHTLDDQAETLLMRLKRGSGLDGLAAIPPRGEWAGIALLRPLLDVPKARLLATLEAEGIGYISDPSNRDLRFERARLREQSEALAALGLDAEAIALSARRLRRAREALDNAARDFLAAHSDVSEAGYALIDKDALFAAADEIALRALAQTIAAIGGGAEPLRLAKLEALLAALHAHPDKGHTLGRCRIVPLKGKLGIFRETRASGLPVTRLHPGEQALWDNRFHIALGAAEPAAVQVRALGETGLRLLKERKAWPSSLPALAGRTLPSCWRGETLLGLPKLGRTLPPETAGVDCRAVFVGAKAGFSGGTAEDLAR
ncbi:MAG TPA: tRNA lysidine(34) synthetase TilS [Methyloceanibacter sp.]|nr:tRNA lysidine(34) synthetase TilS [Methyloceanibacter sp.]